MKNEGELWGFGELYVARNGPFQSSLLDARRRADAHVVHAAVLRCTDSGIRILEDDAVLGANAHALRAEQKDIRLRLAAARADIIGRHHNVKEIFNARRAHGRERTGRHAAGAGGSIP